MTYNPHRHYVVLPVLLLLTVCSTIAGTYSGSTTMPAELKGNPYIALPSGGSVEVSSGGRFERNDAGGELIAGTALVQSLAPVVVRAGNLRMTILGGAAFLSRDDDSVTVAAVSTPVLVQDGETFLAVPAGMQWKTGAKRLSVISHMDYRTKCIVSSAEISERTTTASSGDVVRYSSAGAGCRSSSRSECYSARCCTIAASNSAVRGRLEGDGTGNAALSR
jgi:hypothetical protein